MTTIIKKEPIVNKEVELSKVRITGKGCVVRSL